MNSGELASTLTHDSFAAVANETRLDILKALWADGDATFTDLFDLVDLEDTGQFSYHLNQLIGQFVHKRDDRYTLTNVGREIVMTVFTHVDGSNSLQEPVAMDLQCHSCGTDVLARARGDWLRIDCLSCGKLYASYPVPRAGLHNREGVDMLSVFDQRLRRLNGLVHRGICPNCTCSMDCSVFADAEPDRGLPFVFFHECRHCFMELYTVPATGLLEHPAVISFYNDRGLDLFAIPHWELDWMFNGDCINVITDSPLEYTVDIEVAKNRLRVSLNDEGKAHDVQRVD